MNYFVLILVILCGLVALYATGYFIIFFYSIKEEELDKVQQRWLAACSCAVALLTAFCAYTGFNHLAINSPNTIADFWIWYVVGFASRLPLLQYKGFIFDPHFATEWDEVLSSLFFWAFFGPIQIVFTVWGIYKHWKNPWPWEK